MRADANHQYDVSATWVSIAIVTHLASAVDAFWSANRHNSALHAGIDMYFQPTQSGLLPMTEAHVQYDF
jgi:hypothetical protein